MRSMFKSGSVCCSSWPLYSAAPSLGGGGRGGRGRRALPKEEEELETALALQEEEEKLVTALALRQEEEGTVGILLSSVSLVLSVGVSVVGTFCEYSGQFS